MFWLIAKDLGEAHILTNKLSGKVGPVAIYLP